MKKLILLMRTPEVDFFSACFRQAKPDLQCRGANSLEELQAAIEAASGGWTRLIAFCSPVIVPLAILRALDFNCFNLHPGPPERPGYRPAFFAAREGAPSFGVTLHRMTEQVDAGPICKVRRFALNPPASETDVEICAYQEAIALMMECAYALTHADGPLAATRERWSSRRTTRRDYALLQAPQARRAAC